MLVCLSAAANAQKASPSKPFQRFDGCANGKIQREQDKAKLNLTVRDEQRNKLEQMASLENRSISNLIEVMADERWKRLAEQQALLTLKPWRRR